MLKYIVMIKQTLSTLKVDRTQFSVVSSFDDDDRTAYWHSRTPHERLRHLQTLREINYGDAASARLQRVFEVAQRKSS